MSARRDWPALVLAAGLGTRLRPLSDVRAKAALPVAGRPLILRILERLRASGVTRVVINLHHRAETITAIVGDGSGFGLDVRYSWEPEILGSGGGPARALPLLAADRFFVLNGDTLSDVGLGALAEAHLTTGALATLAVAPADLERYNAIVADADGRMQGIAPRGSTADAGDGRRAWHFVGAQAMSAAALSGVSATTPSDILREVYPRLMAAQPGSVRVQPLEGGFHDVGTPGDYFDTVRRLAAAEGRPLDRGAGTVVAASARVEDCIVWNRVTIGAGARLLRCVIADDVEIPAGAHHEDLVITRDAAVPLAGQTP